MKTNNARLDFEKMTEENLFDFNGLVDGLIEKHLKGSNTREELVCFTKNLLIITKYKIDTLSFGKQCHTCADPPACKGCLNFSKWQPKYSKITLGICPPDTAPETGDIKVHDDGSVSVKDSSFYNLGKQTKFEA